MKRILVIDDDEQVRALLLEILERAGFGVVEAANGVEGINRYREEPTDVVITDINMPKMSGIEVLRAGPLSTVQDTGRRGFRHLGVALGGAVLLGRRG